MVRAGRVGRIVVVGLVLGACTTKPAPPSAEDAVTVTSTVTSTIAEVPEPPPLDWQACDGLECATLTVPLDYDDADGGDIELAVARRPSASDDPVGSLIVNPGGPGGSGIAFLREGGARSLTESFDVVAWDPRGIGASRPLECARGTSFFTLDPQPDDPGERAALERSARAIADECAAADLDLLASLTTETAARDVDQLRRALGGEPLNYLGFSYGSHIGLRYAELFPDDIRAMTLDGVVDPREDMTEFLTGQAVAIEEVLGDNLAVLREVAARVEADPLPSRTGTPVGPGILGVAAFASIYGTSGERQLAAALDDALAGDGTALARLADTYVDSASFGAYLGVICVDGPRPPDLDGWWRFIDAISGAAPTLGASVGNELLPCAFWPVPPSEASSLLEWPPSLPPILLVASTADAATPLDDAVRVQQSLPSSVLLVRDGPGHTSFGASRCVQAAVTAYFVDLVVPDEGTMCGS
jgi:pimeloyl-ACP methyl ester carboxylesterase